MSLSSFICNSPRSFYDTAYSNNHIKIHFSKQIEMYRAHTFLAFKFHIKYIVLHGIKKTSLHDKRKRWRWPDHLRYIIFRCKINFATKRFSFSVIFHMLFENVGWKLLTIYYFWMIYKLEVSGHALYFLSTRLNHISENLHE